MHEHLTIDHVVDYFQTDIARHTLQDHTTELKQIQRVTDYLTRVGQGMGEQRTQHMMTINAIATMLEREISIAQEGGRADELFELQSVAGLLMKPAAAHHAHDIETRFRTLAARAANAREALLTRHEDD